MAATRETAPSRVVHRPSGGIAARRGLGHGRRLRDAIEAFSTLPVLVESRRRALALVASDGVPAHEIVSVIESDVSLTVAVLRAANHTAPHGRGTVETVVQALGVLTARGIEVIARDAPTFDFFANASIWDAAAENSRRHAVATQRAAAAIAASIDYEFRDRLRVTSLLHDIGALVLIRAYPGYPDAVHNGAATPEDRVFRERAVLGVDHATVGGVIARRWGLPATIAAAIERHHAPDACGEAGIVRLADMLGHYQHGRAISPSEVLSTAQAVGLPPGSLQRVMCDLAATTIVREGSPHACPLSRRERDLLMRLASGQVSKEIAFELGLASSTVRSHLHNVYLKLEVAGQAQAVLCANERGWL